MKENHMNDWSDPFPEMPKTDLEATNEEIVEYLRGQNSVLNPVIIEIQDPSDRLRRQGLIVSKKERHAALEFVDEFLAEERVKQPSGVTDPHDLSMTANYALPENVAHISYSEENRQNPGKSHTVGGFDLN